MGRQLGGREAARQHRRERPDQETAEDEAEEVVDDDGANGPKQGPRTPGRDGLGQRDPASHRPEAENHGGGQPDLEQIDQGGTERIRSRTAAAESPPSRASCATPPRWIITMPSAAPSSPGEAARRGDRADRPRGDRKREQVSAGRSDQGGTPPRRRRRPGVRRTSDEIGRQRRAPPPAPSSADRQHREVLQGHGHRRAAAAGTGAWQRPRRPPARRVAMASESATARARSGREAGGSPSGARPSDPLHAERHGVAAAQTQGREAGASRRGP